MTEKKMVDLAAECVFVGFEKADLTIARHREEALSLFYKAVKVREKVEIDPTEAVEFTSKVLGWLLKMEKAHQPGGSKRGSESQNASSAQGRYERELASFLMLIDEAAEQGSRQEIARMQAGRKSEQDSEPNILESPESSIQRNCG